MRNCNVPVGSGTQASAAAVAEANRWPLFRLSWRWKGRGCEEAVQPSTNFSPAGNSILSTISCGVGRSFSSPSSTNSGASIKATTPAWNEFPIREQRASSKPLGFSSCSFGRQHCPVKPAPRNIRSSRSRADATRNFLGWRFAAKQFSFRY